MANRTEKIIIEGFSTRLDFEAIRACTQLDAEHLGRKV